MRKTVAWVCALAMLLGITTGFILTRSKGVQTATAGLREFTTFIEGAGVVSAPIQTVLIPMAGQVSDVLVKEGQRVEAGDELIRMDTEELSLQYQEALLALNAQKKAYDRQNDALSASEKTSAMVSAQTVGYDIDQFNSAALSTGAEAVGAEQVDMARLKVREAKAMLDHATVRAAISGVVVRVDAQEGAYVSSGYQAAIVSAMDEAEIDAVFADLDASSIEPGMPVELHGGCLGSVTCAGVVTEISPMAETQQSQGSLKSAAIVKIKPSDSSLFKRLGASVELKVITGNKTGLSVPIEALAQDASGLYVFVIRRGRAVRTPVEVGVLDEYYADIDSGVECGDVVALNPADIIDGMKVSGS